MGATESKRSINTEFLQTTQVHISSRTARIAQLLEDGADVNIADKCGYTALMRVTREGNEACVRSLINAGADVNRANYNGSTALCIAAWKGHQKCIDTLIDAGGGVGSANTWPRALMAAVSIGHARLVELLVEAGADVNISEKGEITPLMVSSRRGHTKCVELLLNAGADVNSVDHEGASALIRASWNSHPNCVKLLIQAGADVNASHFKGNTALMSTVGCPSRSNECHRTADTMQCIKLLLQAGAHVNKQFCTKSMDKLVFMLLHAAGAAMEISNNLELRRYLWQERQEILLKNMCRETIRKHLINLDPSHLFARVPQLGLPPILASYLLYDVSLEEDVDPPEEA